MPQVPEPLENIFCNALSTASRIMNNHAPAISSMFIPKPYLNDAYAYADTGNDLHVVFNGTGHSISASLLSIT